VPVTARGGSRDSFRFLAGRREEATARSLHCSSSSSSSCCSCLSLNLLRGGKWPWNLESISFLGFVWCLWVWWSRRYVCMFEGISQGFGVLGFEMKGESGQFILVWWEGIGKFFEFP